ncbi:MAG: hypothetical protein V3U33_02460 [candidate division NC10 bacterium]
MRRVLLLTLVLSFALSPWKQADTAERPGIIPDSFFHQPTSSELREVIEGAAYVGERKGVAFRGDPVVYEYLLNHLDFASQIARALDLSDYVIEKTGTGSYKATTPRGGWALLNVVYADRERRVVLADGKYGRAVVVLQYNSFDRGGESYMVNNLYGYLRADNPILNVLLTLFGGTVHDRIEQVFMSVAELSARAYEAPDSFTDELFAHPEIQTGHLLEFAEILREAPIHEARADSFPPS